MKKEQTAEKTIATLVTVISDLVVRSTIDSARNLILRMTEKTRAAAESIRQRWLAVSYRYRIHE